MKIEKALQAPIIFFPQIGTGVYHWNPPTKQESMRWVHKVRFPPKKKPKHSLRAESTWQPFFGPRKGFYILKDGKRYYNQWRGLFEDNLKVKRSIEIETAFIVASKESDPF
jgi:hypothetical protein